MTAATAPEVVEELLRELPRADFGMREELVLKAAVLAIVSPTEASEVRTWAMPPPMAAAACRTGEAADISTRRCSTEA